MRFITEYRDKNLVHGLIRELHRVTTKPWTIMEICGGQTHAIMRYGLHKLLPEEIELVHGPGCPVCVTPIELIDKAIAIASQPEVIFTSYGDMIRVPGSKNDLFSVRAMGGDVRVVYSPLDALRIAQQNPDRQVVFFAIGFETTAPANAMSIVQAKNLGIKNYSMLVSQVCVPPAIEAILNSKDNQIQGFLAAGHVCTVMGYWQYEPICKRYRVPIVVTGFEPLDILRGVYMLIRQLEEGRCEVENAYSRVVTRDGNQAAQRIIQQVFMDCDRNWRGIGVIPLSGWKLRPEFAEFDAEQRFLLSNLYGEDSSICISGQILQGRKKPFDCTAFGKQCTPDHPLGATMVSSEGACAAYFQYGRDQSNERYNV